MWHLSRVFCHFQLWFSDGLPLGAVRGSLKGDSSRLIVDNQGFLDLTTVSTANFPSALEDGKSEDWKIVANGVSV